MPATTPPTRDEARIRACIDAVAQAIRVKDVNALMTHYTPDTIIFDLMPLQTLGSDAIGLRRRVGFARRERRGAIWRWSWSGPGAT
jgi:hypothetical protein